MERRGKLWWTATLSSIVLVFGWVLEWLGKAIGVVAPWWAWSLMGMAAFAMYGMVRHEIRIDSQFSGLAERVGFVREMLGLSFTDVGHRIAKLEETLAEIRKWQESEPLRKRDLEERDDRRRAWDLRHKDELAALADDMKSADEERAAKARTRFIELRHELPAGERW